MRGSGEHGHSGYHSKKTEGDQAKTIQHHRSKLPVVLDVCGFIVVSHFFGDDSDLLEDGSQLPVNSRTGQDVIKDWRVEGGPPEITG